MRLTLPRPVPAADTNLCCTAALTSPRPHRELVTVLSITRFNARESPLPGNLPPGEHKFVTWPNPWEKGGAGRSDNCHMVRAHRPRAVLFILPQRGCSGARTSIGPCRVPQCHPVMPVVHRTQCDPPGQPGPAAHRPRVGRLLGSVQPQGRPGGSPPALPYSLVLSLRSPRAARMVGACYRCVWTPYGGSEWPPRSNPGNNRSACQLSHHAECARPSPLPPGHAFRLPGLHPKDSGVGAARCLA